MAQQFSTAEVARLIGVNRQLIRRWAHDKGIGSKVGRDWVFSARDVERLRDRPLMHKRAPA